MLTLLWLLLPVAAAAGWLAGRRSAGVRPETFWQHTRHFHQSLSELFNDRSAVDEDAEDLLDSLAGRSVDHDDERTGALATIDRDTAETHIALGNLFRRRGDTERAILLHESLLAHDGLPAGVRADARYELARDYESAGLLDRSQAVFRELIDRGERVDEAYGNLLELHESEHDWVRASEVAREYLDHAATRENVSTRSGPVSPERLAHYCCERALEASRAGYDESVDSLLDEALAHAPGHARAHLMRAERAVASARPAQALEHYEAAESARPDLVPEFIDARFEAFEALADEPRLDAYLQRLAGRRNAYSVIRRARQVIEARQGVSAGNRFFKEQILKRPSLRALRDWARDQVDSPRTKEPEKVQIVVSMLDRVVEDKPAYLCAKCGFRGHVLHWRCPSCGTWDSVSTIIGVEGE